MNGSTIASKYDRIANFSAGPGALPVEVLEQARDEILNWNGSGVSVMEMSHRGKHYESIHAQTKADLVELLGIPENYSILFLQGGASLQFTMLAMNLLPETQSADYIVTGTWGKKAQEAAQLEGKVNVLYDAKSSNYNHAPDLNGLTYTPGAAYAHFTSNETIQGVDYWSDPPQNGSTWICDMSSNFLSRPIDVSRYAMIYAGAQKNMGPAGVTIVIIRNDLLEKVPQNLPPMLDYKLQNENDSLYNTPPCFSIYMCGLVAKWLKGRGGLAGTHTANQAKAKLIYDAIDAGFYSGHAVKENRSLMNIPFNLPSEDFTGEFLKQATAQGMIELKGHRSVGGCRASTYNAVPIEACQALADFMREFAAKHG